MSRCLRSCHRSSPKSNPWLNPKPAEAKKPKAEPKAEPKVELEQSGLVMIETDPSKARTPQAEPEQPQLLGRPRRQPRAQQTAAEAELVQIETRK